MTMWGGAETHRHTGARARPHTHTALNLNIFVRTTQWTGLREMEWLLVSRISNEAHTTKDKMQKNDDLVKSTRTNVSREWWINVKKHERKIQKKNYLKMKNGQRRRRRRRQRMMNCVVLCVCIIRMALTFLLKHVCRKINATFNESLFGRQINWRLKHKMLVAVRWQSCRRRCMCMRGCAHRIHGTVDWKKPFRAVYVGYWSDFVSSNTIIARIIGDDVLRSHAVSVHLTLAERVCWHTHTHTCRHMHGI